MIETALVAVVIGSNWASNRLLPRWAYVPFGLASGTAAVALARHGGATADMLGLDRHRLRDGIRVGGAVATVAAAAVAAAVAVPASRPMFADERVVRPRGPALAYEVAVRIPLGTAVAEELLFRSALLGLSLRRRSWTTSIAWTSTVFGLWHVLPSITTLQDNAALRGMGVRHGAAAPVASSVAVTTVGGVVFAVLRKRSGSIVAPILVHAAGNAAAFLAARWSARRASQAGDQAANV